MKALSSNKQRLAQLIALLLTTSSSIQPIEGFHYFQRSFVSSRIPLLSFSSFTSLTSRPQIRSSTGRKRPSSSSSSHRNVICMCQLLGMNSANPVDFTLHFHGFRQRGGRTDVHSHGWGLAFYEGRGLRCFHDTQPAATSEMAHFVSHHHPIHTHNMMAHIRYATQGHVDLCNVHPFQRELWGIPFTFCHNGDVPMAQERMPMLGDCRVLKDDTINVYHPIGQTDSERVFCAMLNAMRARFQSLPSLPVLYDAIQELCQEIVDYDPTQTIFNFLLACGPHVLWAYSWPGRRAGSRVWNGLYYIVQQPPFATAKMRDLDCTVNLNQGSNSNNSSNNMVNDENEDCNLLRHEQEEHCVSFIATKPLTDEDNWVEFQKGQLIVFDQGMPHMGASSLFPVELNGHGLRSDVMPKSLLEDDMRRYKYQPPPPKVFLGAGI